MSLPEQHATAAVQEQERLFRPFQRTDWRLWRKNLEKPLRTLGGHFTMATGIARSGLANGYLEIWVKMQA